MPPEEGQASPGRRLRDALLRGTIAIPGAFNALTAMQIERAGFEAVYVSGAAVCAARGIPDIGLLSLPEMVAEAGLIADAVSIPAIVDADTGYGPPLTVMRAVREFERAGLAGIQLEDQEMPKKCGHLEGKRLVSIGDMVTKIAAAVEARGDREFVIIARTDARAVEGLDAAVTRARAYAEAGADALFPEALESADDFRTFAEAMRKADITLPLIANMTEFGKTPYLAVEDFALLGYRAVLFPVTALRVASKAVDEMLAELKRAGSQRHRLGRMQTRRQLYDLLGYADYAERDRRLHEHSDGTRAQS